MRRVQLKIVVLMVFISICVGLCGSLGLWKGIRFLDVLELKSLDARFVLRGTHSPDPRIVIIEVDQKSLDHFGRWPWPRSLHSRLLQMLKGIAHSVVFDMVFSYDEDPSLFASLDIIEATARIQAWYDPRLSTLLERLRKEHDSDGMFEKAIEDFGSVHLGYLFFVEDAQSQYVTTRRITREDTLIADQKYPFIKDTGYQGGVLEATAVEPNIERFTQVSASSGFFNVTLDIDGTVRWVPLVARYKNQYYPALSVQVARTVLGIDQYHTNLSLDAYGVTKLGIGEQVVPVDTGAKLFVNYRGPKRTYPSYSYSDVLRGKIPLESFRDKVVLVGVSSPIVHDLVKTPFSPAGCPGVEVHATVIDNILNQDYLHVPLEMTLVETAVTLGLCIMIGLIIAQARPIVGSLMALCLNACYLLAVYVLFVHYSAWMHVVYPLTSFLSCWMICTVVKLLTEEKQGRFLKKAFKHFVNPSVVDKLLDTPKKLSLGGHKAMLTVLFSDIRNFTGLAEMHAPETLVEFLNEHFSRLTEIVMQSDGTVDKYIGDGLMAFWGAPLKQERHAYFACKTALEMIKSVHAMNPGSGVTDDESGVSTAPNVRTGAISAIGMGVGINTGEVIVGNMGSKDRFQYTAIGDNVNLTFRIEPLNKIYGTEILVSESTFEAARNDFEFRYIDEVRVKGKEKPVKIYQLLALRDSVSGGTHR